MRNRHGSRNYFLLSTTLAFGVGMGYLLRTPEASATCLMPRDYFLFLEPGLEQPRELIYVYLNAADSEDGVPCPYDIRRTGLSIEDAENLLLSVLTSINDTATTSPRMIYGGRVCHDTLVRNGANPQEELAFSQSFHDTWAAEVDTPPGIVVQASPCPDAAGPGELFSAIAWATSQHRGNPNSADPDEAALSELPGAGNMVFKAFRGDDGQLCPRVSFPTPTGDPAADAEALRKVGNGKVECHQDSDPDISDTPCQALGEQSFSCTCFDLTAPGTDYLGYHICYDPDLNDPMNSFEWSKCKCRNRGYEAFNNGDGTMNPNEPIRCDVLGPADTKDFYGVMLHEIGHLLGLNHAGLDGNSCTGPASADGASTDGVMGRRAWARQNAKGRRFFPDDLRGLDWLFTDTPPNDSEPFAGAPAPNKAWDTIYFESSDAGANWGAAEMLPLPEGLNGTAVRVGVTSATDDSGFQAVTVGGTGPDFPIYVLTRDDQDFDQVDLAEARVTGASSRYPASVAYGAGRLAIAWTEQSTVSRFNRLSWAVNDISVAEQWSITDLETQDPSGGFTERVVRQEHGLAYASGADVFLLAAISNEVWSSSANPLDPGFPAPTDSVPWLLLLDPVDGALLMDQELPMTGIVHTIGKPVCHPREDVIGSHCVLPFANTAAGGPLIGGISLLITNSPDDGLDIVVGEPETWEPVSLAAIDIAGTGMMAQTDEIVGAITTPGQQAWQRFVTFSSETQDPDLSLSDISEDSLFDAPGDLGPAVVPSWSTAVGSRRSGGVVTYSVWRSDPDQPDGGTTGGDGGAEESGDETGGSELGGGNGCECRVDDGPRHGEGGLPLMAGGLLAMRYQRRRRRGRRDNTP